MVARSSRRTTLRQYLEKELKLKAVSGISDERGESFSFEMANIPVVAWASDKIIALSKDYFCSHGFRDERFIRSGTSVHYHRDELEFTRDDERLIFSVTAGHGKIAIAYIKG